MLYPSPTDSNSAADGCIKLQAQAQNADLEFHYLARQSIQQFFRIAPETIEKFKERGRLERVHQFVLWPASV